MLAVPVSQFAAAMDGIFFKPDFGGSEDAV